MKTNHILILGAVALSLSAVSPARATEVLLSPRAQGNQIHRVDGANNDVSPAPAASLALLSPRAQGNQIHRVAGTNDDPNLVALLQSQPGSPRTKTLAPVLVYQIAPMK